MIKMQRILQFLLYFSISVYSRPDSLTTIAKSGKWLVVAKENEKIKNEKIDNMIIEKHLNKIDHILSKNALLKKRKDKDFDTLKFETIIPGKVHEYRTDDANLSFIFKNDHITYAGHFVSNHRRQTSEEIDYYNKHGKLPDTWATISVDSVKQIAWNFLSDIIKVEDLEQYDSIDVMYLSDGYLISFWTHPGDRCELRRCSVEINPNSGAIIRYSATNLNYRNYEPDYLPAVSRKQAIEILSTDLQSKGIRVAFEDSVDNKADFDYLIGSFCMMPKKVDSYYVKNPEANGWLWRALLVMPGVASLYAILIDTETGEILYFDNALVRHKLRRDKQK